MEPQNQICGSHHSDGLLLPKAAFDHTNDPIQGFLFIRSVTNELHLIAALDAGTQHAEHTFRVRCGVTRMKFDR